MRPLIVSVSCVCLLLLATVSGAEDTGGVTGRVFEAAGTPARAVGVRLVGLATGLRRSAESDSSGTYVFDYLPPGDYQLEFEHPGLGQGRRGVSVVAGVMLTVDVTLGAGLAEHVEVSAAATAVDARSSSISISFDVDTVDMLPLERSYRALFQLVPGAAENRSAVGIAVGASRQDNVYRLDGVNITNPSFGYLGSGSNPLDLLDMRATRGGAPAELGRASGMTVQVVTRHGSNTLSGAVRNNWLPKALIAGPRLAPDLASLGVAAGAFRDPLLTSSIEPSARLGGPAIRNRLFFYLSGLYSYGEKWDSVNRAGERLPSETRKERDVSGKVMALLTAGQQLVGTVRTHPTATSHAGLGAGTSADIGSSTKVSATQSQLAWSVFGMGGRTLNVQFLDAREYVDDVPDRDLGYLPVFEPGRLADMGQYADPLRANLTVGARAFSTQQDYQHTEYKGVFAQPFSVGAAHHVVKVGANWERAGEVYSRTLNGWGTLVNVSVAGTPSLRARYYTMQPPQQGDARTLSVFVQDEVQLGGRVVASAGVLANRDSFSQQVDGSGGCPVPAPAASATAVRESDGDRCTFLRFGFGAQVQPRLGVSLRIRTARPDRFYANWGRHSNTEQRSSARSLAPRSIYQTQTVFDLRGNVLSSSPLSATTGKLIDPDVLPTYTDELLLGYSTALGEHLTADVSVVSRATHRFIEDVPTVLPDSGPYVAANLPCSRYAACQGITASRMYRALVFDVRRVRAGRWFGDASYAWSRLEGNFDLDYSSVAVFNTSSFIQDGPGTNVHEPYRTGPLLEDRPHVLKVMGSWEWTSAMSLSAFARVQSGSPWSARGRDWEGGLLNYLEPAGSHRNPTWTNVDLMVAYRTPDRHGRRLILEARVLNAANSQPRLATDSLQYLDLRTLAGPPYFAPYLVPNPFFGTGSQFAPPRRAVLTASMLF